LVAAALLSLVAVAVVVSLPYIRDPSALLLRPSPRAVGEIDPDDDLFSVVLGVERQPLLAQVNRIRQALQELGAPWPRDVEARIELAEQEPDGERAVRMIQAVLDPLCVAAVRIAGDGQVRAMAAPREIGLDEQGARVYLVKVHNQAGAGTALKIVSPETEREPGARVEVAGEGWLELRACEERPLYDNLSGLALEYRAVQLGSIAAGKRVARLMFRLGTWPHGSDQPRSDDGVVRTWRFDQGLDGWVSSDPSAVTNRDGLIQINNAAGPFLAASVDLPAQVLDAKVVARTRHDTLARWFWLTRGQPLQNVCLDLETDGQWHEYSFRFTAKSPLSELRFMPSGAPGTVEIRSISLAATQILSQKPATISVRFDVRPAREFMLDIKDDAGQPTTAALEITDDYGRIYPARGMRLVPDFFFQKQVYRADGETLRMPAGRYHFRFWRGPESIPEHREVTIGDAPRQPVLSFRVRRWVDPAKLGWWSGDHHIHAGGCRHFDSPGQGVQPADLIRHCLGEDLKVAFCLTWEPCFQYQRQFFTGHADAVSRPPYLLRYDVEVSGFGSYESGHLCLLGLKTMEYPGSSAEHPTSRWPTLGLTTARWAKAQGAVVGPAHSAGGLVGSVGRVAGTDGPDHLPDFTIPPYNGIGANEFIVDVTHDVPGPDGRLVPAIDFLSTMDSDRRLELNMWYHVLNCGLRPRIAGETDFPCFSGQRIGIGRTYVKVDGTLTDDAWLRGLRAGRSYVSDGTCHLMDFRVEPVKPAEAGQPLVVNVGESELRVDPPAEVLARVKVVCAPAEGSPGSLKVEAVLNGYPHAFQEVPQDGAVRELVFKVPVSRSSWLAIRVFPRAHTNPIFVSVGGRPIRASRRSAEWCLRGVDQCWHEKATFYHPDEIDAAQAAYEHARLFYRRVRDESPAG
jgi:hypothetical protein